MIKSRRNGLENSVWLTIFLDDGKVDFPLIDKAPLLITNYVSDKSEKQGNLSSRNKI